MRSVIYNGGCPLQQGSPSWHKFREKRLGMSELSAAIGVSPFTSRKKLWRYKFTNERSPDSSQNPACQWGIQHEPHAIEKIRCMVPDAVLHPARVYVLSSYPEYIASLDLELEFDTRVRPVEIKCPWKKLIPDRVPIHYYIQITGQMALTQYPESFLFYYVPPAWCDVRQELLPCQTKIFKVKFDPVAWDYIHQMCQEFLSLTEEPGNMRRGLKEELEAVFEEFVAKNCRSVNNF